jgi:hypothetical protein
MIKLLCIVAALALEVASWTMILAKDHSDLTLFLYLIFHTATSLILAVSGWYLLPEKYRQPRKMIVLLLFNFSFFIPLLGLPSVYIAVLISGYRRHTKTQQPFAHLVMPEFVLSLRDPEIRYSQGGVRSRLSQANIPTPQRLQSLLALQGMPARVSSPLLQDMLGDASDDIRLVAYGLLDSREKKITEQIHRELVNLRSAESKELRLVGLRHLAEQYWEMIYSGLAQGDLRTHSLAQALMYANSALELAGQDTGLLFIKGRILLESKQYEESEKVLRQAMEHGLPESRALPYIVEIAFKRRDFKTVHRLLTKLSAYQLTPIMKIAIQFWVNQKGAQNKMMAKVNAE